MIPMIKTVGFLKLNLIYQLYKSCVNHTYNNGYNGLQINNFLHKQYNNHRNENTGYACVYIIFYTYSKCLTKV